MYDYENAYAYDTNTSLEKKSASGYEVSLRTKYRNSSNLADKHYSYNEMITMATLKYKF